MIGVWNEGGPNGVEKIRTHRMVFENGVNQIIHGEGRLLLGVYVYSIIYVGPLRIVSPGIWIAIEAPFALAVLEDHDLPLKTVRMLENSIDQSSQEIGVCCASALPLAVYFDQHHVVRIDNTRGTSPRMPVISSVELQAVACK
jgi:hypothetical protein